MTQAIFDRGTGRQLAPGIWCRKVGKTAILMLKGSNDREYQSSVLDCIRRSGLWVAIELDAIESLNSGFVGLLVAAARELAGRGGQLYLLRPPPAVQRLVAITGTGSLLAVIADESELVV